MIIAPTKPQRTPCRKVVSPWRRSSRAGNQRPGADAFEQDRLLRLKFDQQREYVQHVDQLGGVLGQPVIGLNLAEPIRR